MSGEESEAKLRQLLFIVLAGFEKDSSVVLLACQQETVIVLP